MTRDPLLQPEIAELVTPLGEDELRQLLPPDATPVTPRRLPLAQLERGEKP